MKSRKLFSCSILMALTTITDATFGQAPSPNSGQERVAGGASTQPQGRRRNIPRAEALRLAMEGSNVQSAALPILVHTLQRGLRGMRPESDLDRIFVEAMRRHPGVRRDLLEKFVADYENVPAATKAKAVPSELLRLDASRPIQAREAARYFGTAATARAAGIEAERARQSTEGAVSATAARKALWLLATGGARSGMPMAPPTPEKEQELLWSALVLSRWTRAGTTEGMPSPEQIGRHLAETFPAKANISNPKTMSPLSPGQLNTMMQALLTPFIDHAEPAASPSGYTASQLQQLQLVGDHFSPNKSDDKIRVLQPLSGGTKGELTSMIPQVAAQDGTVLQVNLSTLKPGHYWLQVQAKEPDNQIHESNMVDLYVATPPPPPPTIQGIDPAPQYPGKNVIVNGQNFQSDSGWVQFHFEPMDKQLIQPVAKYLTPGAVKSSSQIALQLPMSMEPGHYQVQVFNSNGLKSNLFVYEVQAYQFKHNYQTLECLQSYGILFPIDNLVVVSAVVHDNDGYERNTASFAELCLGSSKLHGFGADGQVFQPDGSPASLKRVLAVATRLYALPGDQDVGARAEAAAFTADVITGIAVAIGGPEMAFLDPILTQVLNVVFSWLNSDDGPTLLGGESNAWTLLELQAKTNNQIARFQDKIDLVGPSPLQGVHSHYVLQYQVQRVPQ